MLVSHVLVNCRKVILRLLRMSPALDSTTSKLSIIFLITFPVNPVPLTWIFCNEARSASIDVINKGSPLGVNPITSINFLVFIEIVSSFWSSFSDISIKLDFPNTSSGVHPLSHCCKIFRKPIKHCFALLKYNSSEFIIIAPVFGVSVSIKGILKFGDCSMNSFIVLTNLPIGLLIPPSNSPIIFFKSLATSWTPFFGNRFIRLIKDLSL